MTDTGFKTDPSAPPINLPSGYWHEIWSQVIARTWSAQRASDNTGDTNQETTDFLAELPRNLNERKKITWEFLLKHRFVEGVEPLNFPNLELELVQDGVDPIRDESGQVLALTARYATKNAYRNINGWTQDLVELGGRATIKVPSAPAPHDRARALDWYIKQGFHLPFAANNQQPFAPGNSGLNVSSALGFSGSRIGDESASAALDCDAAWFGTFPQILASAWHHEDTCERLTQRARKLQDGQGAGFSPAAIRARDALFAEFGYSRPVGLEVDFELVDGAAYDPERGWTDDKLKPKLVIRIPPPPADINFHPIALADYRATGKAQLFTT